MSYQAKIRRLALIIEHIELENTQSTLQKIHEYINQKLRTDISERTVQRDIEALRYEFGIDIIRRVIKSVSVYTFNEDYKIEVDAFYRIIEMMKISNLLTNLKDKENSNIDYILFDKSTGLKGIEKFEELFKAIKNRNIISFNHFNYQTNQTRTYTIQPYLLKEYQKRWYVVGTKENSSDLITFGIDRIESLEVKNQIFIRNQKINPRKRFKEIVGISMNNGARREIVKLKYRPDQFHYVQALPLHYSQAVLEDSTIELYLVPNYELMQNIMMHQAQIKVVEPKWLADEIKALHKKAYEQYL